jgi:sugar/nucleoside kinase (ribokinase family)
LAGGTSDSLTNATARPSDRPTAAALRSALIPAPKVDALDPTGCGDVFGAAAAARLFAGDPVEAAIRHANAMAARNAAFRGAGGLSRHLRGELVLP